LRGGKILKYLIIGNSVAATAAVDAIRERDTKGDITLVSDEPQFVYSRPLISYLLAGNVKVEQMYYRGKNFYDKTKVRAILGRKVTNIDAENKRVVLEDGEELPFEKLLIATGGRLIVPKTKGSDLGGVFTFTKWDDVEKIKKFLLGNEVKRVVIVGGGLIGLKAAEGLIALGIKITIVELSDRIMSSTFDSTTSEMMKKILEKRGVEVVTKNTADEIIGNGPKVGGVVLRDGTRINCEMVVFAIGVSPNIELVKDSGIKVNRGIHVDEYMRTNFPDIYAAGDVVEAYDMVLQNNRPIAIWPNASIQGAVAGHNMAGGEKKYVGGFAMNSIEICDIPTISMGLTDPPAGKGYEVLQALDEEKPTYRKIILKDNVVVGAIFVNDIDRAGIFTSLIKDKIDTSSFKDVLLKEEFGLAWFPKEYRKHLVVGPGIEI
jgi:NAD(P)H-nitrite reductase large subunit